MHICNTACTAKILALIPQSSTSFSSYAMLPLWKCHHVSKERRQGKQNAPKTWFLFQHWQWIWNITSLLSRGVHEHTSLACLGTSLASLLLRYEHTSQVRRKLAHATKHNDDTLNAACLANSSQQLRTESSAHTLNNHWAGTMVHGTHIHILVVPWKPSGDAALQEWSLLASKFGARRSSQRVEMGVHWTRVVPWASVASGCIAAGASFTCTTSSLG